jgi:sugar phosphate isomerase/epimerase
MQTLTSHGVRCASVSPGTGKPIRPGQSDLERLQQTIKLARQLGTSTITTFVGDSGNDRSSRYASLHDMAQRCRADSFELLLENSANSAADTINRIEHELESADVGLVWDPSNAAAAGERDLVGATRRFLPRIRRVHVKSFDPVAGHCVDIGQGVVDWNGIINCLKGAGYQGLYTIEPHQPNAVERNLWNLLRVL